MKARAHSRWVRTLAAGGLAGLVAPGCGGDTPEAPPALPEPPAAQPFPDVTDASGADFTQGSGAIVNISSTAGTKGFGRGTAYAASKFALRGMTECWRDELRRHDVRVILCNPSEVQTDFSRRAGGHQEPSPRKLVPEDIADAVIGVLRTDARGFVPEFSVFATNPF